MTTTKQIIECAMLKNKLEQIDSEVDELERAAREWQEAFAQLEPADYGAMLMAQKLLKGESYRTTSDNHESSIAVAQEIGATIDIGRDPVFGPPEMTTLWAYPPLWSGREVT